MELEYAFLADAAQIIDGKLYVLGGGINRITTTSFPTVHPHLSLVVRIEVRPSEFDREHSIEIQLWDADGKRLGVMGAKFKMGPDETDPTRSNYLALALDIHGQRFPKPGGYAFYVLLNGEQRKTVQLLLAQQGPQVIEQNQGQVE